MKDSVKAGSAKKSVLVNKVAPVADSKGKDKDKGKRAEKARPDKARAEKVRTEKVRPVADEASAKASPAVPAVRIKLVRDSFTMPRDEFELIAKLKLRALEFKRPTKKSELLRAGLQQLAALDEVHLRSALAALRPLPTGRPKKLR